jgi:hypothetical protein
MAIS